MYKHKPTVVCLMVVFLSFIGWSSLGGTVLQTGQIVEVDRQESQLPYTYFYYIPSSVHPEETVYIMHIATASPPLNDISEADEWARGQLENYVMANLLDEARFIGFTVAVPHWIKTDDRSGCACVLQVDNFISSRVKSQYYRPDIKFIQILRHFMSALKEAGFSPAERLLVTGTSGGGMWAHRFTLLHPELVEAVAPGSCPLWTMPVKNYAGRPMPYQLGVAHLERFGLKPFDPARLANIPFLVFIGSEDTNDPFREAPPGGTYGYTRSEINWYIRCFGRSPQERSQSFCDLLNGCGIPCEYKEFPGIGHMLTFRMKETVVNFFRQVVNSNYP